MIRIEGPCRTLHKICVVKRFGAERFTARWAGLESGRIPGSCAEDEIKDKFW